MLDSSYNPDILTCLANLSSDEVFTPPKLANEILDQLPPELWHDKDARFLDPACKSGIFLREIAKRLDAGLEERIPDRQERINHIFSKQLYGFSITELTSLLSRRSVYCSKAADGKYSVCEEFDSEQGNIIFNRVEHVWAKGRCTFCGASQKNYERGETLETHAYQFIHAENPEDIFNMKFDVIVGNPPYQLDTGGVGRQAKPIYQKFVQQAKKLNPRFLTMIIPSRWFAGGMGLGDFREEMLNDKCISRLVDFPIASDVFPGVRVIGGICYFLWEKEYQGKCTVTTYLNNIEDTTSRFLNQHDIFVRFNKAIPILEKIQKKNYSPLSEQVSGVQPFGLPTPVRPSGKGEITLYANNSMGNIEKDTIPSGIEMLYFWKVLIGMAYGEGGESRGYPRMILGKPIVAPPPSACTMTYLVAGIYERETEANNLACYLRTKFLRFLVGLRKNTQHISKGRFTFVPSVSMKKKWTDEELNTHFRLTKDEIAFIEAMVRPMEPRDE